MTDVDLFGAPAPDTRARRAGIGSHHSAASMTDEWITPRHVINALATFDLDPCSPGARRPWDTAALHYDATRDGLTRPWDGRVWLNPPYSEAGRWLARLSAHGHGTALVFARTETQAWHEHVWPAAYGVLFLRGRLTFCYVDGTPAPYNAGAPSALVAYGAGDAAVLASCDLDGAYVTLDG